MKAARLYGIEDMRVEDIAIPEINEDEVLIKVKASFICGTDVRFYKSGLPGNSDQPLVAGHEIAGVVEKVGSRVTGYAPGQGSEWLPTTDAGL